MSVPVALAGLSSRTPAACVFCDIAAGRAPASVIREWPDALAIRPRGGVSDGHVLVIPRAHVADAIEDPVITGSTMMRACELGADLKSDLNLIANVGPDATQTIYHLHIHLMPRSAGDGLMLPWTPHPPTRTNISGSPL
ncbi:HIT family protein [Streptomyces sp. NPDC051555]|uniref:HIT family protein n=1 Tax=Streptomyces sp. NPDC051555 TaxID=3365657 RepID=UPI00379B9AAE